MTYQGEFERMRSMRLDDAMLIEKLRGSQNEIQDALNEVIGVMTSFAHHLD
jgi:hypothetical protein